jgi:hypothetical protein
MSGPIHAKVESWLAEQASPGISPRETNRWSTPLSRIETWPKGKVTFGGGEVITLHFAAIVNYEEVQRFFIKVRMEGLHYLRELSESNPHRHVIEMEFDRTGDRIRIIAGKVSMPPSESTDDA